MADDRKHPDPPEPLLHKLLVPAVTIVVGEVCTAAKDAFARWHRERIRARRPKPPP